MAEPVIPDFLDRPTVTARWTATAVVAAVGTGFVCVGALEGAELPVVFVHLAATSLACLIPMGPVSRWSTHAAMKWGTFTLLLLPMLLGVVGLVAMAAIAPLLLGSLLAMGIHTDLMTDRR